MSKIPRYIALQELARRKGLIAKEGSFKLSEHLFDKQLAFVEDPSPFKCAVTTRRAGKTISCAADLTHTCLENPDVICLYITLSRKNAKRLVWPEFKKLNERFKLGGEVNESDLSIRFPNNSMLYLLGASDRTSIEDFRGLPIKKAYLDESQSFPSYIEQLIDDVLGPALLDHNGQLILIGTPGAIPSGYFFDLSKNPNWSHHTWSFFDNPKLPFLEKGLTHQDMLQRELTRRGVDITNPSIQREWFGKWIVDEDSLVYHYNKEKNDYASLPSGHEWTYILGVDLGFEDSDALAVLAYGENDPYTYLVEEVVTKRQDISSLCRQIEDLQKRFAFTKIVVDTGGLGKKITEEISRRFSVPMVAAEKTRKVEFIELMNDALRTGKLKIKASSRFAHDAMKVEWDHDHSTPDKKVISKRFHSDICEAVLYAWRDSYSYTYEAKKPEPEFGTAAWSNKEAEMMFQTELERLEKAKEEFGTEDGSELDLDNEKVQKFDRPKGRYDYLFKDRKLEYNEKALKAPVMSTIVIPVYLVIGSPGVGKSWVCEQLTYKFNYLPNDNFIGQDYLQAIKDAHRTTTQPLLIEAPFSISQLKDPLEARGIKVIPVFIIEEPKILRDRYRTRENKEIPHGHLTRQETYKQRVVEYRAFSGNSQEVLEHLKNTK